MRLIERIQRKWGKRKNEVKGWKGREREGERHATWLCLAEALQSAFSPVHGRAKVTQKFSSSKTKDIDEANPLAPPSSSIAPLLHQYPSNHLCIVTNTTGPPGSVARAPGQDCSLTPSFLRFLPGRNLPTLADAGLCQTSEQSLICSYSRWNTQRENMKGGRWQPSRKGE